MVLLLVAVILKFTVRLWHLCIGAIGIIFPRTALESKTLRLQFCSELMGRTLSLHGTPLKDQGLKKIEMLACPRKKVGRTEPTHGIYSALPFNLMKLYCGMVRGLVLSISNVTVGVTVSYMDWPNIISGFIVKPRCSFAAL